MSSSTTLSPNVSQMKIDVPNVTFRDPECGNYDPDYIAPYRLWCDGVLVSVVACVGLVGNILALVVLSRPRLRDVFHQVIIYFFLYYIDFNIY